MFGGSKYVYFVNSFSKPVYTATTNEVASRDFEVYKDRNDFVRVRTPEPRKSKKSSLDEAMREMGYAGFSSEGNIDNSLEGKNQFLKLFNIPSTDEVSQIQSLYAAIEYIKKLKRCGITIPVSVALQEGGSDTKLNPMNPEHASLTPADVRQLLAGTGGENISKWELLRWLVKNESADTPFSLPPARGGPMPIKDMFIGDDEAARQQSIDRLIADTAPSNARNKLDRYLKPRYRDITKDLLITAVRNKASSMMGEAQWSESVGDAFRTVKEALVKNTAVFMGSLGSDFSIYTREKLGKDNIISIYRLPIDYAKKLKEKGVDVGVLKPAADSFYTNMVSGEYLYTEAELKNVWRYAWRTEDNAPEYYDMLNALYIFNSNEFKKEKEKGFKSNPDDLENAFNKLYSGDGPVDTIIKQIAAHDGEGPPEVTLPYSN
jgi:hypothetical protein